MFRAFSRPSSGAQWLQRQPLVLPSYRGDSRTVFVVGPARPRTQHDWHHDTRVKPEAAAAVVELLMMGGKTPETCWAVNRRQDNKLEKFCIWLVIYLNWIEKKWYVSAARKYLEAFICLKKNKVFFLTVDTCHAMFGPTGHIVSNTVLHFLNQTVN